MLSGYSSAELKTISASILDNLDPRITDYEVFYYAKIELREVLEDRYGRLDGAARPLTEPRTDRASTSGAATS